MPIERLGQGAKRKAPSEYQSKGTFRMPIEGLDIMPIEGLDIMPIEVLVHNANRKAHSEYQLKGLSKCQSKFGNLRQTWRWLGA